MPKQAWRDLSDSGWTQKPWKKKRGMKKPRQRFATKEDAEKDRLARTGVVVRKKNILNGG